MKGMDLTILLWLVLGVVVTLQPASGQKMPEFLAPVENMTVSQGMEVVFTCIVNHLAGYKVAWIRSDTKAILAIHTHLVAHNPRLTVTHNGHKTWKLLISNVQKNDSGTYMCQIDTHPMMSQKGYLEVVEPPDILEDGEEDYVAVVGESVKIMCTDTGVPEPTVVWRREDSQNIVLRPDGTRNNLVSVSHLDGDTLQLNNVQRSDTGVYLCIASNGVPPAISKRFIIQVLSSPVIKVTHHLVEAPSGTDVVLQCSVETSPKAMHTWYKQPDQNLMPNYKYVINEFHINDYSLVMNITIRDLDASDSGSYVCSSVNAVGKAEGTIRLAVVDLPKTTTQPVVHQEPPTRKMLVAFEVFPLYKTARDSGSGRRRGPDHNHNVNLNGEVIEVGATSLESKTDYRSPFSSQLPSWVVHQEVVARAVACLRAPYNFSVAAVAIILYCTLISC